MSNAEWESLKQAASNLAPNLSKEKYIEALNEIKEALQPAANR
jgi:hypothetical protein